MSVVALEEAADAEAFGGKAAQLASALRHGLPVPSGFAVSTDMTAAVARGDARAVAQLDDALAVLEPSALAVRSSAVGEDSAEASFAGQHRTCLNVTRAHVPQATADVWRSATESAAGGYRQRIALGQAETAIGVIVQKLVDADVAGVLFTCDPMTGADERVIEASWGLGEVVVAGHVIPDRFRLTRTGEVLQSSAGVKDIIADLDAEVGTTLRDADENRARQLCLDSVGLSQLAALAEACEGVFPGHLDLEWAFADDQLWLLQARPITAMKIR